MAPPPDATPRFDRAFVVLCAQVLVLSAGHGLIVPILPLYAGSFGVDATMIGLLLAAQSVPRILVNVPAGRLADRHGAHRLLAVAAAIAMVSAAASAAATTFWWLLVSRVLQGIGGAISHTAGLTYTATVSPPASRGRHVATYQGSFLVGIGLGPVIGGSLAQVGGYRAPFVAFSVVAAATALWVMRALPDPRTSAEVVPETPGPGQAAGSKAAAGALTGAEAGAGLGWRSPYRNVVVWACVFGFVAAYTRTSTRDFGVVLVATEVGAREGIIGAVMALIVLGNVAVLYVAGRMTDRYGARTMIALSWTATAAGMGLFAAAGDFTGLFLAALVYGVAAGIGNPVPAMYIAESVPRQHVGAAMGTYRTLNDFGMVVGPLAMGGLVQASGVRVGLWTNVGLVVVSVVVFLVLHRRSPTTA